MLAEPECVVPGRPPRRILMRRFFDTLLQQDMLLRIVVEETVDELVVITVHKASRSARYLRGFPP